MSAELTSQGSEVIGSLGPVAPTAGVCVDLLQDRVCELQDMLSKKQKQLQKQLDLAVQKQVRESVCVLYFPITTRPEMFYSLCALAIYQ